MHSSRMRTACTLLYMGGDLCLEDLPDRDPPDRTETPPDRDHPGHRPPLVKDPSGHVTCGACWDRDPPCEQNDTSVYYIITTTSFVYTPDIFPTTILHLVTPDRNRSKS